MLVSPTYPSLATSIAEYIQIQESRQLGQNPLTRVACQGSPVELARRAAVAITFVEVEREAHMRLVDGVLQCSQPAM